jgi:hypothetical protein
MGTGIGTFTHTSGNSTEGQGNPIRIRLKIGTESDATLYSDIVTITNQTVANNRTYVEYTFYFPNQIKIAANTSYEIWYSDYGQESYNVVCCSKSFITGETIANLAQMYIYHSGKWCRAKKYVYHDPTGDSLGGTSPEGPDHLHVAGTTSNENYTPATCGTDGSYWITTRCAQCNARMSREKVIIPASGLHNFITSEGVESMYCLTCGTSNPNFNPDTV